MPRNRASSPQSFDTNLLEPDALVIRDGLQTALRSIERVFYHDDSSIMHLVTELCCRPHVFEYIMSTLDTRLFEKLSKWIIARFPALNVPNVNEALGIRLLERLSSSLMPAERVLPAEQSNELREYGRKMGLSLDALKELDGYVDGVNVFPTSRKRLKASARKSRPNTDAFHRAKIPVPTTVHEAHTARGDILLLLKGVLGNYLHFLRQPGVSDLFKRQLRESGTTRAGPITESIRASLCFDNVEGFGEWRILLSTKAQRYLREARRGYGVMFEAAMKKMKELSQGHFSGDNQKQLTGPRTIIPVYEAGMTGDTSLVYRIDCIPDGEVETQAISVFGIYAHAQMPRGRFWDTLSQQLGNKGPDYVSRCTFRDVSLDTGDDITLPASFPQSPIQEIQEAAPVIKISEEDLKDIHSMLVLERFVILSQALLNSILADQDAAHVFTVSVQEQEIIENTSSCYVIGRSGTGKTTTMLFKMLGIERAWKQFPNTWDKPRQIFVTQSRVLAARVEEYFSKLMLSVEAASHSPEELRRMGKNTEKEMEFIDLDDIAHWRSDLPTKFSDLADEHFPLFITYERLCLMLQNDFGERSNNDGFIIPTAPITQGPGGSPTTPPSSQRKRRKAFSARIPTPDRDRFISYLNFLSRYWNRFP